MGTALQQQIDRLASIVDDLAATTSKGFLKQVNQSSIDISNEDEEQCYIVVARQLNVASDMLLHFRDATQIYVRQALNHYFTIYEIWEDESYLALHNHSVPYRQYQKDLVDCLETPPQVDT